MLKLEKVGPGHMLWEEGEVYLYFSWQISYKLRLYIINESILCTLYIYLRLRERRKTYTVELSPLSWASHFSVLYHLGFFQMEVLENPSSTDLNKNVKI